MIAPQAAWSIPVGLGGSGVTLCGITAALRNDPKLEIVESGSRTANGCDLTANPLK